MRQDATSHQACLALHAELTEALSYSHINDPCDSSFRLMSTVYFAERAATGPALRAPFETARNSPHYPSNFQQNHAQRSTHHPTLRNAGHCFNQNYDYHHADSGSQASLQESQAEVLGLATPDDTIFNPSEKLVVPSGDALASSVLSRETAPVTQDIFKQTTNTLVQLDHKDIDAISGDDYFKVAPKISRLVKTDADECRKHHISWWGDNEVGDSDFDMALDMGAIDMDLNEYGT